LWPLNSQRYPEKEKICPEKEECGPEKGLLWRIGTKVVLLLLPWCSKYFSNKQE